MKKLLAILLAAMMVFALAACGNNDDNPSGSENNPGTSQSGENNDGGEENNANDWTANFSITGLTTPDGFTVSSTRSDGGIGNVKFGNVEFGKDGGFTDADFEAFAQMVWNCCENVSSDGIYKTTRDSSGNAVKGEALADLVSAKSGDRYTWCYTEGDMIMSVNIELFDENTLIFETYQK